MSPQPSLAPPPEHEPGASGRPPATRRARHLVVGLALVALLAGGGVTAAAVLAGGDSPDEAAGSTGEGGPAEQPAEETAPVEEDPGPILVGDRPYLSPCRLVTLADVERVLRPLGDRGRVEQTYVAEPMTRGELRAETRYGGGVEVECRYDFADSDGSSFSVEVEQFPSTKAARERWEAVEYLGTGQQSDEIAREDLDGAFDWVAEAAAENERDLGGQPVEGADDLLYVPGQQRYLLTAGHALVWLQLSDVISVFADEPLSPAEYAAQTPRMRRLAALVRDRVRAGLDDQAPVPVTISGQRTLGGADVDLIDACALLGDDVFEALLRVEPEPYFESTSLARETRKKYRQNVGDPYAASPSSTCRRKRYVDKGDSGSTRSAELTVRYAANGLEAFDLLEDDLAERFAQGERGLRASQLEGVGLLRKLDSDADAAYVFDALAEVGKDDRYTEAFVTVGPYEITIDADRGLVAGTLRERVVADEQYLAAVDLIAEHVHELTGSQDG
ncbi:hypothetical protein I601_2266 [Nocardioides dokdonensis FR1436]|uniref:Uncharacterized protein n=1 Tax=Nocardioides dokdonensis FR1436 TaxID=1300347 RepID=A0A1A9GMH7_9ACTN|nr:hypothetical protein [Nocardioides dokdonensis]ANH38691.1 hypothetical protein I601_2266 [Nocardioides dokdonensis FR1436]